MADLQSELRAFVHTFNIIRDSHPDLPSNDEHFTGSLEAECSLHRIIGTLVRENREESTLAAAIEKTIEDLKERVLSSEVKADRAWETIAQTLLEIRNATNEDYVFVGSSYSIGLTEDGLAWIEVPKGYKPPTPTHLKDRAKKVEALYLERLKAKAMVDQIKAEEKILAERRQGILSTVTLIDQQVMDELPSLLEPGKKTVKLPMVDITLRDLGSNVIVDDVSLLPEKYKIYPEPPPPPPPVANIPLLLMDLENDEDIWGAHLGNGRQSLTYKVKK